VTNSARVVASTVDNASGPLDRIRGKWDALQRTGAKGLAIGVGAAIGAKAFTLLESGISHAVAAVGDAVNAYREQEVASGRLSASLKANVPAWDGNTDAIRRAEKAGIDLGFTDTETTNALALLVAATHDVGKAMDLLAVAQDLARFKGISLTEASEALTKVEGGSYRILKSLGIALKDGATQTEALAAVQKVAGGQARTYANSDLGAVDAAAAKNEQSQERLGKAFSKLGAVILPVVADAVDNLTRAFFDLGDSEDQLSHIGAEVGKAIEDNTRDGLLKAKAALEKGIADLQAEKFKIPGPLIIVAGPQIEGDVEKLQAELAKVNAALADSGSQAQVSSSVVQVAVDGMAGAFSATEQPADEMRRRIHAATSSISKDIGKTRDDVVSAINDLIDRTFDPMINAAEIAQTKLDLADARRVASAKDASKQEIADAKVRVLELEKQLAQEVADQTKYGDDKAIAAKLYAQLTSSNIVDGLNSGDAARHSAAATAASSIIDELAKLPPQAGGWGASTGNAWLDNLITSLNAGPVRVVSSLNRYVPKLIASSPPGKESPLHPIDVWGYRTGEAWWKALDAALAAGVKPTNTALSKYGSQLRASSPPGPASPLHKIDDWGLRTGQTWSDSFAEGLGGNGPGDALGGVAAVLAPSAGGNGGAPAVAVSPAGGDMIVNINSVWPPTPEQVRSIAREIARQDYYGRGRSRFLPD
jgi:hypothetical protein